MADEKKIPTEDILLDNLGKIAYTLDKAYLSRLEEDYGVLPFDEKYNLGEHGNTQVSYKDNIRILRVTRCVVDKDESVIDCFKNVLGAFSNSENTLALVFRRTHLKAEMYFVVKNVGFGKNEQSVNNITLLKNSIHGNFPGTKIEILPAAAISKDGSQTSNDAWDPLDLGRARAISVLSGIPSEKSEKFACQGIEKLLSGIVPKDGDPNDYTIMFLAESISAVEIRNIMSGFEDLATAIAPFAEYQFQAGSSQNETNGEMSSLSHSDSISHAVSRTHSVNLGANGSVSSSVTKTISLALNLANLGLDKAGFVIGNLICPGVGGAIGGAIGKGLGAVSPAAGRGVTNGHSFGFSAGYGFSRGTNDVTGEQDTKTSGSTHSISLGTSESTTYTYKSYLVCDLLEKLQAAIQRIDQSRSNGLWRYAAYVLADDADTTVSVANFLRSITQGDESYIEPSFIQTWIYEGGNEPKPFHEISKYVQHFCHPVFGNMVDGTLVLPTVNVSTGELANIFSFPKKSVTGLPILECAKFGRDVTTYDSPKENTTLPLGKIFHMNSPESTGVSLDKNSLASHTFITGSTGSGKSNTIYKLLENLTEQKVRFLVVEPAKGEYKTVFGSPSNVAVYGTNPNLTDMQLLRLNPFRFPKSVHVLEHLDRLVEIFNVCWPMYAAMPAILKDSLERAYRAAGWDLMKSKNKYDDRLFPTFADVLKQIRQVLNESDYSADNRGDYTGALVTRLRSLTNGINGLIFTADDIADEQLFDGNVIVDLSRVGSTETKALIMGLLVLKLQEHRMDQRSETSEINSGLRHITVLEEAHNLLKRTSTEQTTEGANLLGKSVEMLANSIAEMRTYGEGFIIADQSPGLLDLSVIRNTNTKIILRLPDFSDRELVGRAAGLDDKQIIELGRLEKGVAAITQSDWLEPVLCKVDKYENKGTPRRAARPGKKDPSSAKDSQEEPAEETLLDFIMNREAYRKGDRIDIQRLWEKIIRSRLDAAVKCSFKEYISVEGEKAVEPLRTLVYEFFHADQAVEAAKELANIEDWSAQVLDQLKPSIQGYTQQQIDLVLALIVYEQAVRDLSYRDLFNRFTEAYWAKGGAK